MTAPSWADIKIQFDAPPVKVQAIDYGEAPARCVRVWQHTYDRRLDNMANINGNILTINACRTMGAIEHVRIDGNHADAIKSFTVGERAYVLSEIDTLKAENTRLYRVEKTAKKLAAHLANDPGQAYQVGSLCDRWIAECGAITTPAQYQAKGLAQSRRNDEMAELTTLRNKCSQLTRERDEARAKLEQPRPSLRFDGPHIFTGSNSAELMRTIVDALEEAGENARAEGYPINAADKICEQLRKRTTHHVTLPAKR